MRGRFGTSVSRNAVHGSDSQENAVKEILFFFLCVGVRQDGDGTAVTWVLERTPSVVEAARRRREQAARPRTASVSKVVEFSAGQ